MSIQWLARIGSLLVLFGVVAASAWTLPHRRRYARLLESTPLAILDVALFNACCYAATGIPADPNLFRRPHFLETGAAVWGLPTLGVLLLFLGFSLIALTLVRRKAIGGQDTRDGLITTGTYRFSRHPIYLGIVLISLAIALIWRNFDALLAFPFVVLANLAQAKIEERFDVGVRFETEYRAYRSVTPMFGPVWFWAALLGMLACLCVA